MINFFFYIKILKIKDLFNLFELITMKELMMYEGRKVIYPIWQYINTENPYFEI